MYKSNLEHYLTFWFLDEKKDDHRQICLEERPEEEPRENDILRIQNSNEQIRNINTKEEDTFTKNLSRHHRSDFEYLVDINNYNTW